MNNDVDYYDELDDDISQDNDNAPQVKKRRLTQAERFRALALKEKEQKNILAFESNKKIQELTNKLLEIANEKKTVEKNHIETFKLMLEEKETEAQEKQDTLSLIEIREKREKLNQIEELSKREYEQINSIKPSIINPDLTPVPTVSEIEQAEAYEWLAKKNPSVAKNSDHFNPDDLDKIEAIGEELKAEYLKSGKKSKIHSKEFVRELDRRFKGEIGDEMSDFNKNSYSVSSPALQSTNNVREYKQTKNANYFDKLSKADQEYLKYVKTMNPEIDFDGLTHDFYKAAKKGNVR